MLPWYASDEHLDLLADAYLGAAEFMEDAYEALFSHFKAAAEVRTKPRYVQPRPEGLADHSQESGLSPHQQASVVRHTIRLEMELCSSAIRRPSLRQ